MEAYIKARTRAFSINNIKGSRSGAGLISYFPRKVIHRVLPKTSSSASNPPPPSNPFDKVFLTSSPVDVLTLQTVNIALNKTMRQNNFMDSSICNYVTQLARRMETLKARIIILEQQKNNAESVLSARKKQENGKRGILKDRHSIAYSDVLEMVREKEKKTQERKSKSEKNGSI